MFNKQVTRLIGLDSLRGIAIVLMVIYHFCFDLYYFGYIEIDMYYDWFWRVFRYIIISLFLFSVGISLGLVHNNGIVWHKVWRRLWRLSLAALVVSIGSYMIFPDSWIYFGILHFIAVVSLLSVPFINYPRLAMGLALAIYVGYFLELVHFKWLFNLLQVPLSLPYATQDLVTIIPWWSVILLGMWFASTRWHVMLFKQSWWQLLPCKWLALLGRYSLLIYLLHQLVLFALFFMVIYLIT